MVVTPSISLMELDNNVKKENPVSQPMFLSSKACMKEEYFPFETPCPSSKGFLQGFSHLDDHDNANGSSSNPLFGVQTGSNFDSFDAFPYGPSSNIDLYDYECKPFAGNINGGGGHGQVNDNFQSGGYSNLSSQRNSIDEIGSNQGYTSLSFEEAKPVSFVVQDEVSCVGTAENECKNKMGVNMTRTLQPFARKTWKGRKKNSVVKGQWTTEEDRYINISKLFCSNYACIFGVFFYIVHLAFSTNLRVKMALLYMLHVYTGS